MDKKVISIFLLLIILISMATTYVVFNQADTKESRDDKLTDSSISDGDLNSEIDNIFLEENDEIEIGEMV